MPNSPVTVSDEQTAALSTGVEVVYQTFGDRSDEPLLLVMGLGGPMIWWNADLCRMLAEAGFFVIRYDNRDTGHSTKVPVRVNRQMIVRAFLGKRGVPAYTLDDMADDGFALLDHLGVDRAHVCGVSMGGMIAQTMALAHPEWVLSLTSMSSTTGRRTVGWQDPRLLPMLLAKRHQTREAYVEQSARLWRLIGSPLYPDTPDEVRKRAGDTWDRGISPSGVARQMIAILHQPDRSPRLRGLTVPTLVIHGTADKMVHVSGGRATASAVRGSELLLVPGMGHDIPRQLYPVFVDAISRNSARASVR